MPGYRNDTAAAITPSGSETFAAGEFKTLQKYLEDPAGLTLVTHKPAPWVSKHATVLPVSITSGLAAYSSIWITNDSGAIIQVVANGDTANPLPIVDGAVYPLTQDRDVDSLSITGDGDGNVYVTTLKA